MGRARLNISPEQIEEARAMRSAGASWDAIGKHFGLHENTMRERIDLEFAENKRFRHTGPRSLLSTGQRKVSREEDARALASVIPDTRSRHARWMGDPLPGRSALDRRQGA